MHPIPGGTVKDRREICSPLRETLPAVLDRGAFCGSTRSRTAGKVFTRFEASLTAVLDRATPLGTGSPNVYLTRVDATWPCPGTVTSCHKIRQQTGGGELQSARIRRYNHRLYR